MASIYTCKRRAGSVGPRHGAERRRNLGDMFNLDRILYAEPGGRAASADIFVVWLGSGRWKKKVEGWRGGYRAHVRQVKASHQRETRTLRSTREPACSISVCREFQTRPCQWRANSE